MSINLEKEEIRNKFVEFIKDENQSEIAMNGYIVLKRKYKNNQLLYCKYEYKNKLEGLSEQFENYKIYSKKFDEIMSDKLNTIHRMKAVK